MCIRDSHGNYGPTEALAALLSGTGLALAQGEGGVYALRPAAAAASAVPVAPGAAVTLGTVTVTANQLGEITERSGSYTPGSIATATRLVLTPRETPQTISVTTRQEMNDFALNSIDDVMRHTPGVSVVTYDSERTEYYARGFAIQNFQYDGIPMRRDSAYSAGNTLSDMAIYDRIEVLKGATGLLTGSGDPGATINLIRKKPTRLFQGHAQLGIGSWDNYRSELDASGALNEAGTLRGRAVAAYQDKHSYSDDYKRRSSVFYGVIEADLAPSTLLTLGADSQNNVPKGSSWGGIPLYDSNGNFNSLPRSFNNGANWSRWEQYTRTMFATLEHQFDSGWTGKLQFNHQVNGYDAALGSAASGFMDPVDGSGISMWTGKYIGKTTSNAIDGYASGPFSLLGREHELVVGASFSKRRWTNRGYGAQAGYDTSVSDYLTWTGNVPEPDWGSPSYTNDETTRESGLYAASRFNLRDDLKLITGARLSSYKGPDLKENGVLVPYVGAVYDLTRNLSAYASYTSIFQPQSLQDEQGRTLDPLEGKNYEIGLKSEFFGGRLNASAAYFQLKQDNYGEESGGVTPSGGIAYRAIQGVKTKGFELEMSGRLTEAWQLHAGFNHKISRQQGDKVSTLTPENQFTLYTSYKLDGSLTGLTLGGGARWQDKTWGDVRHPSGTLQHTVKGYWLLDAMARYQFTKNLSATLNVNNLLDKKYYTIFNWYSTYTWGEPRSVTLTVKYDF